MAAATHDKPVLLVTGGAKRVGAALCRAFCEAGWRVVIHCNSSIGEAERLANELGDAKVLQADLLKVGADSLIAQAHDAFGSLDLLINNASTYRRGAVLQSGDNDYLDDFAINFHVPFALMRAFARLGNSGSIINILDARISKDDTDCAGYLLAKKALAEATRLCALDFASLGIRVNGIAPGLVRPKDGVAMDAMAPLVARTPLGIRTTEEEIAAAALYLSKASAVTGEIIFVDSGMHLSPPHWGEKK
ncbi:MAG: SDR family oxidoreductase [Lentisphaeria bacterium]|nr:SDR family oxidoreductase [Lentisphaeria bacterium]